MGAGTASAYYETDRPEVVKLFSKMLWSEWRKKDAMFDPKYGFAGNPKESEGFLFYLVDEPNKSAGDKVTVPYSFQIEDAPGVVGNEVLEGKEGEIETEPFSLVIDKQRHGVKTFGEMNYQRVHFDTVQEGKNKLADWWKRRRAAVVCNHLCGNTAAVDKYWTGHNSILAPDANHIFRPGSLTTDEAVQADPTQTFDVDIVDEVTTIAELSTPPIRPFIYKGNEYYALFLHPNQVADLRESDTAWYNTMQNALRGGRDDDNPLFTRALGKWRNTIIFSEVHLCQGVHSSTGAQLPNTRRAVFCGAGSLALSYGRHYGYGDTNFRWFSSTWDHGDKYYCSASLIWGAKAIEVPVNGTPETIGKIVITTYSRERVAGLGNVGQPGL